MQSSSQIVTKNKPTSSFYPCDVASGVLATATYLAGWLDEAKDDGSGGDNWTTGAIKRAKLQSNHHHQQTNIQFFTGQMPFVSPNQQCQSTEF